MADEVWVVYADEATQLQRLKERSHLSEELARQRIAAQMPLEEKRRRANVVIDNTGDLERTQAQVTAAWHALLKLRGKQGGNEVAQA